MRLRMLAAWVLVGLASLGGPAAARPEHTSAASTELTWKLVNSKCSSSQQAVGRACWDSPGRSGWDVNEESATWTQPTFNADFTYTVPEQIPAGGGSVFLDVTANDVSNNSGLDEQLCVQSPFQLSADSGTDPCAHAFAMTPGSSTSGSKQLTLLPSGVTPTELCPNSGPGSPQECVRLMIELGDGGNLIFTYQAAPAPKIGYQFQGTFKGSRSAAVITGDGSFQLVDSLESTGCVGGINDRGSALVQIQKPQGSFTVHLQSFAAGFCDNFPSSRSVELTYRVSKSTVRCLGVGERVHIFASERARRSDELAVDFCGLHELAHRPPSVRITA